MKARLIINPISGTSGKEGLEEMVRAAMAPAGWEVETVFTRCSGDATRLAADAVAEGCEAVIAAGGDGTVNETAAALCGAKTALGIIPCGSGNGLARHLGIPVDVREGIRIIAEGRRRSIDYATVNRKKFFCTFGVGFDAAVSEAFAQKKTRGPLTYLRSTLETFASFRPERYTITANGHVLTQEAFLVAVCNASQYGNNAYIAPHATIDDGLLDVTIVHTGNPLTTALVGLDMMIGNIEKNMLIQTFRTSHLLIERQGEGASHLDGEPVTMPDRLEILCHPGLLNVFAPEPGGEFKPVITPAAALIADIRLAVHKHFQK